MSDTRELFIGEPLYGGSYATDDPALTLPFVLQNELVEVDAANKLLRIIQPSPRRVTPRCPHFGTCGGCQYQHIDYDHQLTLKRDLLIAQLYAAGVTTSAEIPVHSAEPYGYRNRIRLRLQRVDGALRFGYNLRATTEFLPIVTCPISSPRLIEAAEALVALATEDKDAAQWLNAALEVELFVNDDLSRIQLTLLCAPRTKAPQGSFSRMMSALQQRVPQIAGAEAQAFDPRTGPTGRTLDSFGAAGLNYKVGDETYWVTRGAFFQVNRFLISRLVDLVTRDAFKTLSSRSEAEESAFNHADSSTLSSRPKRSAVERPAAPHTGNIAWDLFAGVGLFSRILARSYAQITAVEASPTAVADLRTALRRLGPQHRAIQQTTLDFLRAAIIQRERPDLIILDPPRAGAGLEVCELLARIAAPRLVYVSCDPTTLARDLRALQTNGYTLNELHLIDLFPQTFHLETVAILSLPTHDSKLTTQDRTKPLLP